jgi:preprotein translocase subunit YajC
MDTNTIIQIISSLGFPIVMCGALFWYMVKQRQAHQEETEHLKDTISENTKVLAELTTLIKVLTNEKER